jgi:hypothetical protein
MMTLLFVGIAVASLIVFLIWRNQRDRKDLNPGAQDAVKDTIADQKRNDSKL